MKKKNAAFEPASVKLTDGRMKIGRRQKSTKNLFRDLEITRKLCPCVATNKVGISIGYILVPVY